MNKRIEELSAEAWVFANNYVGEEMIPQLKRFQNKFAELLIMECSNLVSDDYDSETPEERAESIKEYFGLK